MSIPFYADVEKLSSGGLSSTRFFVVEFTYLVLALSSVYALSYFDGANSKGLKILGLILVIGLPISIIYKVKSDVWKQDNERLKQVYQKEAAHNGIGFLFVLIFWQLLGRWIFENEEFENLGVALFPYLMMLTIYRGVRKEMKNSEGISR